MYTIYHITSELGRCENQMRRHSSTKRTASQQTFVKFIYFSPPSFSHRTKHLSCDTCRCPGLFWRTRLFFPFLVDILSFPSSAASGHPLFSFLAPAGSVAGPVRPQTLLSSLPSRRITKVPTFKPFPRRRNRPKVVQLASLDPLHRKHTR